MPVPPRSKQPFVLAAGRAWDAAKNIHQLERLAPQLPWPLRVADGTLPRPEVEALMGHASIFAAPAFYEPFGLAPLEAASAGCALVLSDIDSFREVWGDAAAYVGTANDTELVGTLTRVIDDDTYRSDLAARARERAAEYAPARMAAAYAETYFHVTDRSVQGARV
jgi:glycosyltransferase involved in cell wall biosynthesis